LKVVNEKCALLTCVNNGCSKCPLSEVIPAEGGWLTIACHELVERVDVAHVMHYAEGKVLLDVAGAVHPGGDGVHKVLNLLLVALRSSSEVLASEFSNPEVPAERGMEILAIADESLGISTIPVDGNYVNGAASAGTYEVIQPNFTTRARSDRRGNKGVALALEGLEILLPEASSITRIKGRLGTQVGFIETQRMFAVTRLDEILEIIDLLCTPEHRREFQAELV